MTRLILGLLLLGCLTYLLSDPQVATAQKGGNSGTVSKVDPKLGVVTINMMVMEKKKKEEVDKEFLLAPDAKITIVEGGKKTTMTVKEALENKAIKIGSAATFVTDGGLTLKELTVGEGAKKK